MSKDRVVCAGKVKVGFISKVPMLLSVKTCSPVPERMGLQLVEVTSTEHSFRCGFARGPCITGGRGVFGNLTTYIAGGYLVLASCLTSPIQVQSQYNN